jgi:hypothetical protein
MFTLLAIRATLIFSACKDNGSEYDKKLAAMKVGDKMEITRDEVPNEVIVVAEKKIPADKEIVYTVERVPNKSTTDTSYVYHYYFDYDENDKHYHYAYDNSGNEVILNTEKDYPRIAGLPDAVSKSIADNFPGYMVVETDKENDKDMDMYEIELHKGEEKMKVKILMDGTLFKVK